MEVVYADHAGAMTCGINKLVLKTVKQLIYLGGCPRIETYCGKADFDPLFRLNSFNTTSIRLI